MEQSTPLPKYPPVLIIHASDNAYNQNSFCKIVVRRSVANVSGKSAGFRITSVDPDRLIVESSSSSSFLPSSHQQTLKVGDELLFINDTEIKSSLSPEQVKQILKDAATKSPSTSTSSSPVQLVVIRSNDFSYRQHIVQQRFQDRYDNITWKSRSCVTLTPQNNPSLLQASLFPLWKTRFKYEIQFDDTTGEVSYQDLYKITFNRSNGACPDQQLRIRKSWDALEEKLHELEAQVEFDRDVARTAALEMMNDGV